MERTDEQKRAFREEFAARRKKQWVATLPLILLIIGLAILGDKAQKGSVAGLSADALIGFLFAYILGLLIFSLKNWRCPACNAYLGKNMGPDFCPKCGVALK